MSRGFRYALIVAAMAVAFIAGHAGPSQAAPQTEAAASNTKPLALGKFTRHHKKHVRHHARSSRKHQAAAKTSSSKAGKNDDASAAATEPDEQLPPSVANARAELTSSPPEQPMLAQSTAPDASTLTESDKAATMEPPANGVQITTSDQLNDMDRDAAATPADTSEPATVALAQMVQPAATANDGSGWSGASLIGKIFIAFGVILTLASAARIIIA
jgi:hypothetical protein